VRLLPRTDLLFLNDEEVRLLTGEFHLAKGVRSLLAQGAKAVALKRGEHGSSLWTRDRVALFPAWPETVVVDPTGAGDCYAGAALAFLEQSRDFSFESLRGALALGTVVASFCVEHFGPRGLGEVRPGRIRERMEQWVESVSLDRDAVLRRLEGGG
jgi:sugar/nucleoside kinase (ribokinase family)